VDAYTRGIVSQRLIRNLRDNIAVMEDAQLIARGDFADFDGIESPLFKNAEDFLLAAFLRDQQHALLRLAQHELVRSHASFALGHAVEFNLNAHTATPAHLAELSR